MQGAVEDAQTGQMAGQMTATGRAAVQQHLLDPLAGLARRRGVAASDHARDLARLVEYLSYMTPANLRGLCELILRHAPGAAGGKSVPCWPDVALVRAWAMALQVPPPRQSDYAQSLIRSALGGQARDEGWVVELFQIARRLGPPPGKYLILKLREEAAANLRRRMLVRDRIERGAAGSEDQAWLAAWCADLAECDAIQRDDILAKAIRADDPDAGEQGAKE